MDVCDAITQLGELFADGSQWTKGAFYEPPLGHDGPARMCLVGGLRKVCTGNPVSAPIHNELYVAAFVALEREVQREQRFGHISVTQWNDMQPNVKPVQDLIARTKTTVC